MSSIFYFSLIFDILVVFLQLLCGLWMTAKTFLCFYFLVGFSCIYYSDEVLSLFLQPCSWASLYQLVLTWLFSKILIWGTVLLIHWYWIVIRWKINSNMLDVLQIWITMWCSYLQKKIRCKVFWVLIWTICS